MTAGEAAALSEVRPWLVRWSPLGGLLFSLGIVFVIGSPATAATADTAADVVRQVEDNEWYGLHGILSVLFLMLLGWFVAGLAVRLRHAGARDESVVALVGGVIFVVLFFVWETLAFTWLSVIPDQDTEAEKLSIASSYLAVDPVLWWVLSGAGAGAGVMAIAASLGAIRTRSIGRWSGRAGLALGFLSLATFAYVGALAWFLWIGVASIVMLAKPHPRSRSA